MRWNHDTTDMRQNFSFNRLESSVARSINCMFIHTFNDSKRWFDGFVMDCESLLIILPTQLFILNILIDLCYNPRFIYGNLQFLWEIILMRYIPYMNARYDLIGEEKIDYLECCESKQLRAHNTIEFICFSKQKLQVTTTKDVSKISNILQ